MMMKINNTFKTNFFVWIWILKTSQVPIFIFRYFSELYLPNCIIHYSHPSVKWRLKIQDTFFIFFIWPSYYHVIIIITDYIRNTSHRIQSGIRTRDLSISRRPLCHLSYRASVTRYLNIGNFWNQTLTYPFLDANFVDNDSKTILKTLDHKTRACA